MISKTSIIKTLLERLPGLPVGHYLDMRTYKRNRSVIIIKKSQESYLLIEDGFSKEEFLVDSTKIKKLLKTLLKKEFPRSNKVRLYSMGIYEPEKIKKNLRKVI